MKSSNERLVKVISLDKRYRKVPYPAVAPYDESTGSYYTGQEIIPGEEGSIGLSYEQMIGKKDLLKKQSDKYGFIIVPILLKKDNSVEQKIHSLMHNRTFNLTLNASGNPVSPKDYWEFNFFTKLKTSYDDMLIAPSKKEYIKGKNYFYVEDKEAEAVDSIATEEAYYNAMSFVKKNESDEKHYELALLLNYRVPNFNINPNTLTMNQLRGSIYEACRKYPDKVLECNPEQNPNIKKEAFFLKLAKYIRIPESTAAFRAKDRNIYR